MVSPGQRCRRDEKKPLERGVSSVVDDLAASKAGVMVKHFLWM